MKQEKGILTEQELLEHTKFWNKKQFRVWSNKEMNRDSKSMQKLLVAIKDLTEEEIYKEKKLYRSIISSFSKGDIEHAISIAPKTFKCKQ